MHVVQVTELRDGEETAFGLAPASRADQAPALRLVDRQGGVALGCFVARIGSIAEYRVFAGTFRDRLLRVV